MTFFQQQKFETRFTMKNKTLWLSKCFVAILRSWEIKFVARVVELLKALKSKSLKFPSPLHQRPPILHRRLKKSIPHRPKRSILLHPNRPIRHRPKRSSIIPHQKKSIRRRPKRPTHHRPRQTLRHPKKSTLRRRRKSILHRSSSQIHLRFMFRRRCNPTRCQWTYACRFRGTRWGYVVESAITGKVGGHVTVGLADPAHVLMSTFLEGPFMIATVEVEHATLATVNILVKKIQQGAVLCEPRGSLWMVVIEVCVHLTVMIIKGVESSLV